MILSFPSVELQHVEYPTPLLEAASGSLPQTITSVYKALESAIAISQVSASISKTVEDYKLLNGPFGALRLAVKRDAFYRYLQLLRDSKLEDELIISELMSVDGLVVGLGWNCVNCAHIDNNTQVADPTAHAEMQAIRAASQALGIPMGKWREKDLCCIEVTSAENCEMCKATNDLWAGTALSVYALKTRTVCEVGFNETSSKEIIDSPNIDWGDTDWDKRNTKCTQVWAGLYNEDLALKASQAFNSYRANKGTPYQPNYLYLR